MFSLRIEVNGVRPLAVNKKTLVLALGGASKLVDRLLFAARYKPELGWLVLARQGSPGVECLIDTASAEQAYQRILSGEEPPPLPSESRPKSKILSVKTRHDGINPTQPKP